MLTKLTKKEAKMDELFINPEILESIRLEISFLYSLGVGIEDIEYILSIKTRQN